MGTSDGPGSGRRRAAWPIGRARRLASWLAAVSTLTLLAPSAAAAGGFRAEPRLGWSHGRHQLELPVAVRYRFERWRAFAASGDGFHALRTRLGLDYRYDERVRLFAEVQQTTIFDLDRDASGASAAYRRNTNSGREGREAGIDLRQLFAEWKPGAAVRLRLGREALKLGTEVRYPEANWSYLKAKRLSQRLLGTVGWTHGERAYDGASARVDLAGHQLLLFGLQPTTGVFDVADAYERQRDVLVAGLDWTARRGTWFERSELGAALLAYRDDRRASRVAGLFGEIEVYTLRASWLGVYEAGPGRIDLVVWGAFQWGDHADAEPGGHVRRRDQRAGAAIAEVGYQLPGWWAAPWLRAGVNFASGDDDPSDRRRTTFFNLLPTNHLYYGSLDQFAFQNLVDLLVQLKLAPFGRLGLELDYHHFRLAENDDFRWAGSGAFAKRSLGYVRNPSRGSSNAGHELDLTLVLPLHGAVTLSGGSSHLWGRAALAHEDARWAWAQLELRY